VPIDALTINATLASGTGDKKDATSASGTGTKQEQIMTFLDKDPRYTMVYEYVMRPLRARRHRLRQHPGDRPRWRLQAQQDVLV